MVKRYMLGLGEVASKEVEYNQVNKNQSGTSFGVPIEAIRESSVYSTIKNRCGGKPHPNLVNMVKVKQKQNSLIIITEYVSNEATLKMIFGAENKF